MSDRFYRVGETIANDLICKTMQNEMSWVRISLLEKILYHLSGPCNVIADFEYEYVPQRIYILGSFSVKLIRNQKLCGTNLFATKNLWVSPIL